MFSLSQLPVYKMQYAAVACNQILQLLPMHWLFDYCAIKCIALHFLHSFGLDNFKKKLLILTDVKCARAIWWMLWKQSLSTYSVDRRYFDVRTELQFVFQLYWQLRQKVFVHGCTFVLELHSMIPIAVISFPIVNKLWHLLLQQTDSAGNQYYMGYWDRYL